MRLTVKSLVIIVLAVVVISVVLMYVYSTFHASTKDTKHFWDISSNINKNTSDIASSEPPPIKTCKKQGEGCISDEDCCSPFVCRKRTLDDTATCLPCANTGDYCEESADCCSKSCNSGVCN
ncbi:MAG: hypothetical protein J7K73_03830 [Nanoarchaeota archaeon]|nr:hypothetical protein [Nanoarchaeota archaeon]